MGVVAGVMCGEGDYDPDVRAVLGGSCALRLSSIPFPDALGVVRVGFYDGFDRRLSRQADVLIRGHRCKVLGTVCMNMMMVDASRVPAIERSDRVTLIGQDGAQNISAGELAKKIGTVHWEAVARISSRFPRLVV